MGIKIKDQSGIEKGCVLPMTDLGTWLTFHSTRSRNCQQLAVVLLRLHSVNSYFIFNKLSVILFNDMIIKNQSVYQGL